MEKELKEAIDALKCLKAYFDKNGFDSGYFEDVFDAGEFRIAYEELYYAIKLDRTQLSEDAQQAYQCATRYFGIPFSDIKGGVSGLKAIKDYLDSKGIDSGVSDEYWSEKECELAYRKLNSRSSLSDNNFHEIEFEFAYYKIYDCIKDLNVKLPEELQHHLQPTSIIPAAERSDKLSKQGYNYAFFNLVRFLQQGLKKLIHQR